MINRSQVFQCMFIAVTLATVIIMIQYEFVRTSITISTASDTINISTASDTINISPTRFGGQQGAGLLALASQQCFISNLGIPAYTVEPFVDNSVLYHTNLEGRNKLKFSDMFNLDTFNRESKKSGYGPIVRLEYFLNHVPDGAILVELRSGVKKSTKVFWDGYSTPESPCYKGRKIYLMNNITVCVVRIVTICCVKSVDLDALSRPNTIMTTQELHDGIFGNWRSKQMNVLFQHWTAFWYIPTTCKFGIGGKIYPSEQIRQYANKYRDTFLKSNKVVAFVLRFEHLIARNYNVDICLSKFRQARKNLKSTLTNASVFVAADLGRYQSESWGRTFSLSGIDQKRGEQIQSTFMNALSDFIDSQWNFDEWDNSFSQVTGGIEDAGYIATIQKSIASTADCLVFLTKGESAFQYLVTEEYFQYHPAVSERCIHFLCSKDCPNCSHYYTKQVDG